MSWDVSFLHDGQRSLPLLCRILRHCRVLETGTYLHHPLPLQLAIKCHSGTPLSDVSDSNMMAKELEVCPLLYVETPVLQGQVPGTLHTGVIV